MTPALETLGSGRLPTVFQLKLILTTNYWIGNYFLACYICLMQFSIYLEKVNVYTSDNKAFPFSPFKTILVFFACFLYSELSWNITGSAVSDLQGCCHCSILTLKGLSADSAALCWAILAGAAERSLSLQRPLPFVFSFQKALWFDYQT